MRRQRHNPIVRNQVSHKFLQRVLLSMSLVKGVAEMQRKKDLEKLINSSYEIIIGYETVWNVSDRPDEQRAQYMIEEHVKRLKHFLKTYLEFCTRLKMEIPESMYQILLDYNNQDSSLQELILAKDPDFLKENDQKNAIPSIVINTGGGSYIAGDANVGGNFVGRDMSSATQQLDNTKTTDMEAE